MATTLKRRTAGFKSRQNKMGFLRWCVDIGWEACCEAETWPRGDEEDRMWSKLSQGVQRTIFDLFLVSFLKRFSPPCLCSRENKLRTTHILKHLGLFQTDLPMSVPRGARQCRRGNAVLLYSGCIGDRERLDDIPVVERFLVLQKLRVCRCWHADIWDRGSILLLLLNGVHTMMQNKRSPDIIYIVTYFRRTKVSRFRAPPCVYQYMFF